jgi:hypothetical protein
VQFVFVSLFSRGLLSLTLNLLVRDEKDAGLFYRFPRKEPVSSVRREIKKNQNLIEKMRY